MASLGARLWPAEWAPQAATLLVWPRWRGDWGNGLDAARDTVQAMANALVAYQPVLLVAPDNDARYDIGQRQSDGRLAHDGLVVADVAADDIWARDTGPVTVMAEGRRHFVDFRFDGWGGKFAARADDELCAQLQAAGWLGADPLEHVDQVLEGGSIETNGQGVILTTRRCLLDGKRNPGATREALDALLAERLGAHTVHWLAHGELIGDDTDGHIDTLVRFVDVGTLVYQGCDRPDDAQHDALTAMADELATLTDSAGTPYRLVALPLPAAQYDPEDGHRLPAGYANFLVANGCVLVPAFDDPADTEAARLIGECFPDRRIIPIDSRALIRQHGGLHCAAMQIPALTVA
ncbi:agmatine deiminase family protein [Salinisphaera sp. Q1T1-3]|nr:agmatine deiminase family protein [Salinisphaera sp. Q1T1-3]